MNTETVLKSISNATRTIADACPDFEHITIMVEGPKNKFIFSFHDVIAEKEMFWMKQVFAEGEGTGDTSGER